MKNIVFVLLFVISINVFADDINIIDYFPCNIGNSWTYTNGSNKTVEIRMLKNSMPDPKASDGSKIYLVENQFLGIGSTSTMYSIKDNKVVILVTKNVLGNYQENKPPYPIELAPAGQEWRYNDRGDDLRLKTILSSCNVDGNYYTNCIMVEERIVNGNSTLRIKKSYYAKGIGLVLVTLQQTGETESIYIKLKECNFTTLGSNYSSGENIAIISTLFFEILAEGINNLPKTVPLLALNLKNKEQVEFLSTLVSVITGYLNTLTDMVNSNTVKITSFLNEPISKDLISSSANNEAIATAIDRALRVIVLSDQLQRLNANRNLNIDDKDFVSGTKIAEKKLYPLFKNDQTKSQNFYLDVEKLYNLLIECYLKKGGK